MPTRVVTLAGSVVAALAWVGLLSLLWPADTASLPAELLLDRDRPSYPFTIQNVMWIVFFVAAGDLLVRHLAGTREEDQLRLGLLPEDDRTVLRREDIGPLFRRVRQSDGEGRFWLQRLLTGVMLQFQVSGSVDQVNAMFNSSMELLVEGRPPEPRGGRDDAGRFGAVTEPVGERHRAAGAPTELYVPASPAPGGGGDASSGGRAGAAGGDPMADPPVGWLTVVRGPGRGRVATLGVGANSIGRDPGERVPLDYGDRKISRRSHGVVTYDPRGRKFYVQPGSGQSLTYVDDEPVLAPRELEPLAHVQMGDTLLRFVPLCGAGFSWDDGPDGE